MFNYEFKFFYIFSKNSYRLTSHLTGLDTVIVGAHFRAQIRNFKQTS